MQEIENAEIIEDFRNGLSSTNEIEGKQFIFGLNELKIQEKTIIEILIEEILNPFNIFQVL